jgi:DNA-binding response OmpR family regulator
VEDDEDFALVVAEALRGRAHIVRSPSLQDAEYQLRTRTFDVIVLDIGMPDGSGLHLLDEVPGLAGQEVPVIILSVAEVPEAVRTRVNAVLIKSRLSELAVAEAILQAVETGEIGRLQNV